MNPAIKPLPFSATGASAGSAPLTQRTTSGTLAGWNPATKGAKASGLRPSKTNLSPPLFVCLSLRPRAGLVSVYNRYMPDSGLWFERKFEFAFPAELFPNLCVRLRGTPARLEEMLRGQPRDLLIARRDEKWTVQEQAGHLLDLEELWNARLADFVKGRPALSAADLQNRKTHQANHNARQIEDLLAEFRAARTSFADRLDAIDHAAIAHTLLHPRLQQPMRLVDHLYFVAEHDDHHLAKIWSALRS